MRPQLLFAISVFSVLGCGSAVVDSKSSPSVREAITLLHKNRPAAALECCDQLLAQDAHDYQALVLRAEIAEQVGEHPKALADYERAFLLRPLSTDVKRQVRRLRRIVNAGSQDKPADNPPVTEVADGQSAMADRVARAESFNASSPNDSFNSNDKHYRHSRPEFQADQAKPPQPRPADRSAQRLIAALAEGQKKDQELREAVRIQQELNGAPFWEELALETPEFPITRFDFGLGVPYDRTVDRPQVPTTGQRRTYDVTFPTMKRRCFLGGAGQTTRRRGMRSASGLALRVCEPPSGSEPYELLPICADNIDNNGNGLTDREDPMCWIDPTNPRSYSRYMDESRAFAPQSAIAPLPTTVTQPATVTPPNPALPPTPAAP